MNTNENPSTNDAPDISISENAQQEQAKPELSKSEQKQEAVTEKSRLWANWRIFIAPERIRRRMEQAVAVDSEDSDENIDSAVPKTERETQIGVLNYIRHEEGILSTEEQLCIDIILRRDVSLTPSTPGIDRYDDWGISQWSQAVRRFAQYFLRLDVKQRRKEWEKFDDMKNFSPEIRNRVNKLALLLDIPRPFHAEAYDEKAEQLQPQVWPDGLSERELKIFKTLSDLDTLSPRQQALNTLKLILNKTPKRLADLRKTVQTLIERFPSLKRRNPYLTHFLGADLDDSAWRELVREQKTPQNKTYIPALSGDTTGDYLTIRTMPAPFFFPVWLENESKERNGFSLKEFGFNLLYSGITLCALAGLGVAIRFLN